MNRIGGRDIQFVKSPRYELNNSFTKPTATTTPNTSCSYPGIVGVKSSTDGTYTVSVFTYGLDESSSSIKGVKQLQILSTDTIPAGTSCIVIKVFDKEGTVHYYMQVPVWLA